MKFICTCNKIIQRINKSHYNTCIHKSKSFNDWSANIFWKNLQLPERAELVKLYNDEQYSILELKNMFNVSYVMMCSILKSINIDLRSSGRTNRIKKKYEETCLEKYGAINALSKGTIPSLKKDETVKERYNVQNVFQIEKVKQLSKETMIKKYNKLSLSNRNGNLNLWWNQKTKAEKIKHMQPALKGYKTWRSSLSPEEETNLIKKQTAKFVISYDSSLERIARTYFDDLGIEYTHQYWISKKSFDFHITGTNIVIEINGDYWHANPKIYNYDSDIRGNTASEIWKRDFAKLELAKSHGFIVEVIWESENIKDK